MKLLNENAKTQIAGGMNLCGDRCSDNIIDNRPGAGNYGSACPTMGSRDDGCPGSPMGPSDAPGTGFAGT
jgi:hypothetical protein